mgnify:FL=1
MKRKLVVPSIIAAVVILAALGFLIPSLIAAVQMLHSGLGAGLLLTLLLPILLPLAVIVGVILALRQRCRELKKGEIEDAVTKY